MPKPVTILATNNVLLISWRIVQMYYTVTTNFQNLTFEQQHCVAPLKYILIFCEYAMNMQKKQNKKIFRKNKKFSKHFKINI